MVEMSPIRRSKSYILIAGILLTLILLFAVPSNKGVKLKPEEIGTLSNTDASAHDDVSDLAAGVVNEHNGVPDLEDGKGKVSLPKGEAAAEEESGPLKEMADKQADKAVKKPSVPEDNVDPIKEAAAKDAAAAGEPAVAKPITDVPAGSKESYVVMIDAGSTGSRVHIYKFDTTVAPPKLLNEDFKMLKPGLSSFDTDTVGAAKSLDPLLELALESVPKDKRGCSPVAVKATAGLRLLGEDKSSAILKEVRRHLTEDYPFPVVEGNGISIMGGGDEGVFAWITTNYLLGNIGSSDKTPTAAVFDLGGGSTQIVFEPVDGKDMIEGEHKYEVDFGGRHFYLYQYSHLGYGLMEGRQKVNALVLKLFKEKGSLPELVPLTEEQLKDKELKASVTIKHPCVPPGVSAENVKVTLDDGDTYLVNFISPAQSSEDKIAASASTQCRFLSEAVLNKQQQCDEDTCSFNGIYQPPLRHQFPRDSDMFVFSYFYDRLEPVGMPLDFTLQEMSDITQLVCSGSDLWSEFFLQKNTIKELNDEPLWCLDLSFMTALLHTGYDIRLARELKTAKTINGNELGWCLGASLPLLEKDSGWTCKVAKEN